MKNIPNIKLGIVVGSTDWLPSGLAEEMRKRLIETYQAIYGEEAMKDIYECSICVTDNEVNIRRAFREIEKAGCNALCLYFANYGPESAGTLMADKFNGPVMMMGAAEEGNEPYVRERKDSLSGFINACFALNLRKTNVHIPDKPIGTLKECSRYLHDFISISRVQLGVGDLKIISFAPRPSSYLASMAPNHLLYDLGVEISEYSELEILDSFRKHEGDQRIGKTVQEMASELGDEGNKTPDILPKLAQYEITVNDWIRTHKGDRKYVALTSTCWPAFPISFGFVPCYVNSRITGAGFPVACEVDVFGAISEYIGQCISDDVVTILNLNNDVPGQVYEEKIEGKEFQGKKYKHGDLFIAYHCGVTCSAKLKSPKMDYHFVNRQLIGEEQSKGTIQGEIVSGNVTLLRLQGMTDGKMRAYVAQGQVLPVSVDTYGGFGIIAVPEMERFIRNVVINKHFPNHTAVIFGHYGHILIDALKMIGISEIDYNHPLDQPYPNENMYNSLKEWY